MQDFVYTRLIENAFLLLALGFIYDALTSRYRLRLNWFVQFGVGAMIGLLGIAIMLFPCTFEPGIVFDARSVLLGVSGLFFGAVPTLVAMLATAAFRISMGGAGAYAGAAIILSSGLLGIGWRHYRRGQMEEISWVEMYLFGIVVHSFMLALLFTLPQAMAMRALAAIGLPVMAIYPLATTLLGRLIVFRLRRERIAADLHKSEERYRSLFENSHAVMLLIDPADDAIIDANPAAATFYGWSRKQLRRKKIGEINLLSPTEIKAEMERAQAEDRRHFHFRHRRADGVIRDVEVYSGTIMLAERPLVYSIVQDTTARKEAETGWRLARFCIENAAIGIFQMDETNGRIVDVNEHACASLGYCREELCAMSIFDIDPELTRDLWLLQQKHLHGNGIQTFEGWHRRKDGSTFPVEITAHFIEYEGKPISFSFTQDISERKRYEQQLVQLATRDELTGLANRNLLYDRLEQAILYANRSGRLLAVLLIDLDRFKVVNDSLGHSAGDELLCIVAQRLLDSVRKTDTVARIGGDEFVVLLPEMPDEAYIGALAEHIVQKLVEPFDVDGRQITVTPSLGISLHPRDGKNNEALLRNADIAMYRAKEEGNTIRFYAQGMNLRVMEALELEADLRCALERDELRLYYQPKVDLASGRIVGVEALLRWQHPQRGMVAPGSFIHLAEETGLIVPIGEWAMATACAQVQAWLTQGLPAVPVAVNLSARQCRTGDLIEAVRRILRTSGLDPRLLELELTESMVMGDPKTAAGMLLQLKSLGVRLALDDFGTGYSSLNYLRRFPFDSLKIDRSFIVDVAADPSAAAVVNSIVAIAHSLGLHAIAEGVETAEQLDFLRRNGCDSYQGFYFSKPIPADAVAELLRENLTA